VDTASRPRLLGVSYKTLLHKIRDCGSSRTERAAALVARGDARHTPPAEGSRAASPIRGLPIRPPEIVCYFNR